MRPLSSSTGVENPVCQQRTPLIKKITGLSLNAKIGLVSLGVFTGLMSYLVLKDNPIFQTPIQSTDTSKTVTDVVLSIFVFLLGWKMISSSSAKEEKIKSTPNKTSNNEFKLNLIETIDTFETQKESLQKWWRLSGDYNSFLVDTMPDLSPSEVETLYKIFKSIEDELTQSSNKQINSLSTYKKSENSFVVNFDTMSNWEPKSPISTHAFKKLFGGFILSLKTSFFAFQSDSSGSRTKFLIFPNNNFKICNNDLSGYDPVIVTREGVFNSPQNTQWKIGEDNICRLVIKEKEQSQEKVKLTSNKIEQNLIEKTDTSFKTQKELLQEWWHLSGDYNSFLVDTMPDLSPSEVETLYNIFKGIENELSQSSNKQINSLSTYKRSENSFVVNFDTMSNWEPKSPISTHAFKKLFGGFILSLKTSFFAFQSDSSGSRTKFVIFPNNNFKICDKDLTGYSPVIVTREGVFNSPQNTQWEVGEDNICRLVIREKEQPQEKEEKIKLIQSNQTSSIQTLL